MIRSQKPQFSQSVEIAQPGDGSGQFCISKPKPTVIRRVLGDSGAGTWALTEANVSDYLYVRIFDEPEN